MAKTTAAPAKVELVPYELLYPAEEAKKAEKLLEEEISSHQNQLDRLHLFSSENTDLINLVHRLPDQLTHEIMVPFGTAAFFPGRLIHTNEFLVLLGEGYYADQTAKQTIGVLKRRGEVLDSKVEGLNAVISDLKARANFFGATANESGEGMVEIREYEEVHSPGKGDSDANIRMTITDEEYARVLKGLDELEMAELAAESASHYSEDKSHENKVGDSKLKGHIESDLNLQECENSKLPLRGGSTRTETDGETKHCTQLDKNAQKSSAMVGDSSIQEKPPKKEKFPAEEPMCGVPTSSYGRQGAFTGTIVEHTTGLTSNLPFQDSSKVRPPNPSKPVSRFKLQKGL